MLALCFTTTAYIVAPSYSLSPAMHRVNIIGMISKTDMSEAEPKGSAPAHGAAAKPMNMLAKEAAPFQMLIEDCDMGVATACEQLSKEEEAKKAWLAKLDVPVWGKIGAAMEQVAVDQLVAAPATVSKDSEEKAKQAWLAKIENAKMKISESAAKKKWLAKLDAPVWGQAAAVMTSKIVGEENAVLVPTQGVRSAVSKEEEAKTVWLAKLDVPSWQGKVVSSSQKVAEA